MNATISVRIRPESKRRIDDQAAERLITKADVVEAMCELWEQTSERRRVQAIRGVVQNRAQAAAA